MTTGEKGLLFIPFIALFTLFLLNKIVCSLCYRLQVTGYRSQVTGHRSQVTAYKSQVAKNSINKLDTPIGFSSLFADSNSKRRLAFFRKFTKFAIFFYQLHDFLFSLLRFFALVCNANSIYIAACGFSIFAINITQK